VSDEDWGVSELEKAMEARSIDFDRASLSPPFIEGAAQDAKVYAAFMKVVQKIDEAYSGEGEVTLFDGRKFIILLTQLAWRSMPTTNSYWSNHSHLGRATFEKRWMKAGPKWTCSPEATLYVARAIVAQGISIKEAMSMYEGKEYEYVIWPNNLIHVFDYT
jgi:hypothetical protein